MKRMSILVLSLMLCIFPLSISIATAQAAGTTTSYQKLQAGSKGDAVTALQNRLIALGLINSKADGIYGKQTTMAIVEAQRLLIAAGHKLPEDGVADVATQTLIFDQGMSNVLLTLRKGSKGERVRQLQMRLVDLKLLDDAADGTYGSNTANAIKAFGEKMAALGVANIATDGVATLEVQDLLNEDLSAYGFTAPIYFDAKNPSALTVDYLYAKSCILMDAPSGDILFDVKANVQHFPASTTKLMTLLLAIEHGNLEEVVTIPASAANVPKDSSLVPVSEGEQMRMLDLLYGLMIRSGNDAANAVAELCAGSVEQFVLQMNEKASQLNMVNTHFVNPHGYHDINHYTTAYDLALLAREGFANSTYSQIVTCLSYTLAPTSLRGSLVIENMYEIYNSDKPFYIAGAAGGKSGFTSLAGFCYVGVAQRDSKTLIAVVLDVPSRDRAWLDMKKLFEYGFAR